MYSQISRDYDGNPDNIESATWNALLQTGGGGNWEWYMAGTVNLDSYCGDEVYMRLRFVSDSDGGTGGPFVENLVIWGNVAQYNSNDLGVTMVTIDPLIQEMENPRDITVTVENFGENKTSSDGRPGFTV